MSEGPESLLLDFHIPNEHPCYEGHFPNFPLVPGALLLAWIKSRLVAAGCTEYNTIKYAKFTQAVKPGMQLSLKIRATHISCKVEIICPKTQNVYSSVQYGQ